MKKKLISIIIPTCGRPNFIERAIVSVLNQSYKNIEIIIVDDNGLGSIDQKETYKIIANYIAHTGKIKYIAHKKNRNGSAARNTGMKHANGEYICFLDDDDEFLENKLIRQYLCLESLDHKWIACYCGHKRCFNAQNRSDRIYQPFEEGDLRMQVICSAIDICGGSTLMIRRKALDKIGGFNEHLRRHQDYEFTTKVSFCGKIAVISEPLVKINVHKGSYRSRRYKNIIEDRINYISAIKEYINKLPKNDQRKFYYCHNYYLLKQSIKHKKVLNAIKYLISCGKPMITIPKLANDTIRYLVRN